MSAAWASMRSLLYWAILVERTASASVARFTPPAACKEKMAMAVGAKVFMRRWMDSK